MSRRISRPSILATALVTTLATAAGAAEPPPAGPPWVRELAAAQRSALSKGTPIFIYFTKKV